MSNYPKLRNYKRPTHINQFPTGPGFTAGHLVDKNAGWRTFKPVIDKDKCVNCLRCYIVCPDGVIHKSENKIDIDYDYCKGCGVCAYECKIKAITMVKETLENECENKDQNKGECFSSVSKPDACSDSNKVVSSDTLTGEEV